MIHKKMKCCDNNCSTTEEFLANHMLPIEIIGCDDEDIQKAHFVVMKKIYENIYENNQNGR